MERDRNKKMKCLASLLWLYSTDRGPPFCAIIALLLCLLNSTHGQTITGGNSANLTEVELQDMRKAEANLSAYLQGLPVSKYKIPPVTTSAPGGVKVLVNMLLNIISVTDVSDADSMMSTLAELRVSWKDTALAWNVSDYGGVQDVSLPSDSIWTPTVMFINSFDFSNIVLQAQHIKIRSDGLMYAYILLKRDTMCKLDHSKYPYDTQSCPLHFITDLCSLNLTVSSQKSDAASNDMSFESQWFLLDASQSDAVNKDVDAVIGKTVTLKLKRKSMFFVVCLVVPMVLTSYMNTLVFLVPPQSGEKVSYLVTTFVSTSVFIGFFKDVMPRGLDTLPSTMKILVGLIVGSFFELIATLIVMYRFHREQAGQEKDDSHATDENSGRKIPNGYELSARDHEDVKTIVDTNINPISNGDGANSAHLGFLLRGNSNPSRVFPGFGVSKKICKAEARTRKRKSMWELFRFQLNAERLDHVLFVVAFVGNSVFLTMCFSEVW